MQEEKHYKTDRNINSKSFGVRIDNYLYDVLITFAEKHGKNKNAVVIEALEDYLYKQRKIRNLPLFVMCQILHETHSAPQSACIIKPSFSERLPGQLLGGQKVDGCRPCLAVLVLSRDVIELPIL